MAEISQLAEDLEPCRPVLVSGRGKISVHSHRLFTLHKFTGIGSLFLGQNLSNNPSSQSMNHQPFWKVMWSMLDRFCPILLILCIFNKIFTRIYKDFLYVPGHMITGSHMTTGTDFVHFALIFCTILQIFSGICLWFSCGIVCSNGHMITFWSHDHVTTVH